jgi:hypothetical protein
MDSSRRLSGERVIGHRRNAYRGIVASLALALLALIPGGCGSLAAQAPQEQEDPKTKCWRSGGWWFEAGGTCIIDF